jgi:hypothetical protein
MSLTDDGPVDLPFIPLLLGHKPPQKVEEKLLYEPPPPFHLPADMSKLDPIVVVDYLCVLVFLTAMGVCLGTAFIL